LLRYASNGVTSPVLMAVERWEMERVMEDLIAGLPGEDQEITSVSMSTLSTYGVVHAIYTFSKYKTKRNTIAL
ncbi:unnamed protein product, partial [Musa textilis]